MIYKSKTTKSRPHKPPAWFSYWVENDFRPTIVGLKQDVSQLKQEIANVRTELKQDVAHINARLDNIVKKNNLIE